MAGQYMRTMFVSHGNFIIASVIPVILCAPKYLAGEMTLGTVMQAAAAFIQVQYAFNWIVDNYPRLAEWTASARRASNLLVALDGLDADRGQPDRRDQPQRGAKGAAIRLKDVSVALSDGTVVVDDADVTVQFGEKVLVAGESGTGKSTLVRAIAGLWPWGEGEIMLKPGAKMFLMPQKPYIPLGTLRRATTYPRAPEDFDDEKIAEALEAVGLEHLIEKLDDEEGEWDRTLSGGEQQRLAFARLFLHEPDIVVMDEATSALDPESQAMLMEKLGERLPEDRDHQRRPPAGARGVPRAQGQPGAARGRRQADPARGRGAADQHPVEFDEALARAVRSLPGDADRPVGTQEKGRISRGLTAVARPTRAGSELASAGSSATFDPLPDGVANKAPHGQGLMEPADVREVRRARTSCSRSRRCAASP